MYILVKYGIQCPFTSNSSCEAMDGTAHKKSFQRRTGLSKVLILYFNIYFIGAVIATNPDDTMQLKAMNAPYVITEARCQTGKSESEHWLLTRPFMALTVNSEVFFLLDLLQYHRFSYL